VIVILAPGPVESAFSLYALDEEPEVHREHAGALKFRRCLRGVRHDSMHVLMRDDLPLDRLARILLEQRRNLVEADVVAGEVQNRVRWFLRLAERRDEVRRKVVQVRVVGLCIQVADDVERVAVDVRLCPGTPDFLTVLVVEVPAADEGVCHLAGVDGRMAEGSLVALVFDVPQPHEEEELGYPVAFCR